MTEFFSEDDVITTVPRLTRSQLVRFVEVDLVRPTRIDGQPLYRHIDIARLELLCDLSEDFDLDDTVLGILISLIDQLHAARRDSVVMARAIETLPTDLRSRISAALSQG